MAIPEKYKHIDFKPPKSVADAAARGLELRKKNKGKGGLSGQQAKSEGVGSGVQRAVNLKNRDTMSPSTVKRMKAFFDRHEKSKEIDKGKTYETDRGYIAWLLWGANPGQSWANKIVRQMEAADKKAKKSSLTIPLSKKAMEEDVHGDYMAPQQMHAICDKAMELKELLDDNEDPLPDWLESKISAMADDMDEVYNYMMHGDDAKDGKVWEERREPEEKLTPRQKELAKNRAKREGRAYPNKVDNMWAAQQ